MMILDRQNGNHTDVNKIAVCDVVSKSVYLGAHISNKGGCSEKFGGV